MPEMPRWGRSKCSSRPGPWPPRPPWTGCTWSSRGCRLRDGLEHLPQPIRPRPLARLPRDLASHSRIHFVLCSRFCSCWDDCQHHIFVFVKNIIDTKCYVCLQWKQLYALSPNHCHHDYMIIIIVSNNLLKSLKNSIVKKISFKNKVLKNFKNIL